MTLPPNVRIGQLRLAVSNLPVSLAFYINVLGFRKLGDTPGVAHLARLIAADSSEVLLELQEEPGLQPLHNRRRLGLYHFAVLLPDRQALGSFAAHIRRLGYPAGSADHLVSEAYYLVDPDGLSVEVYADRPKSTWRYRGSELQMVSDPIDLRDLLAAGSGVPWTGLPAGSKVGHMHFYVDDLSRAAAFYYKGLGFDKTVTSYPGALFVSAGGYHHHVGLNTWMAGSPVAGLADPRLLSWELCFPDSISLQHAEAALTAAGFTNTDPWNNTVVLSTDSRLSPQFSS